jgi:hypothetical protein
MFKWLRRLTQCSRGIHWRMKYDSGMVNDMCSAGTCSDCGYRTEGVMWSRSPMPKCKPAKADAAIPDEPWPRVDNSDLNELLRKAIRSVGNG